ncbi:MAG TPA: hypothetical protein VMZ27_15415 [Candidatus Saccharimonadales bacterium]|nr:hypothetical protein [Candidatus Saccharimonadales bacterium]
MNLAQLQKKLVAIARANPPSDAVPYTFEKRIMARIAARAAEDPWLAWGAALWRGAAASIAISVLAALLLSASHQTGDSRDLETTVFAAAQDLAETW